MLRVLPLSAPEDKASTFREESVQDDLRREFAAIHYQTVGEMLHLLDGFYINLGDGLFELASRVNNKETLARSNRYFEWLSDGLAEPSCSLLADQADRIEHWEYETTSESPMCHNAIKG